LSIAVVANWIPLAMAVNKIIFPIIDAACNPILAAFAATRDFIYPPIDAFAPFSPAK